MPKRTQSATHQAAALTQLEMPLRRTQQQRHYGAAWAGPAAPEAVAAAGSGAGPVRTPAAYDTDESSLPIALPDWSYASQCRAPPHGRASAATACSITLSGWWPQIVFPVLSMYSVKVSGRREESACEQQATQRWARAVVIWVSAGWQAGMR